MYAAISIAISLLLALPAVAAGCRDMAFEDTSFTICEADPAVEDVRLFLNDGVGKPFGSFNNVEDALTDEGAALAFAMNAGMYHPDRSPVGLYIEDGEAETKLLVNESPGNFGLLPNGVLCIIDGAAAVIESRAFARKDLDCRFASQSGPMLVIDGALHPRFIPRSDSEFVRNGVGVTVDGLLVTAISNRPVNFHRFARLFRDVLETPNAIFFDGKVSRLYAPELNRHDIGLPMGPILGVVRAAN